MGQNSLPFIKGQFLKPEKFRSPRGGSTDKSLPPRNAREHAKYLLNRFDKLEADLASKERVTDADRHLVTFHVSSEAALDEKKLESKRDGSRVIDFDPETKEVVVDAPANLKTFIGKLRKYQESTEQTEAESLKNQPLIEAIDDLQLTPFEQVVGEALQRGTRYRGLRKAHPT
ncbi:MAG: hypothetical protein KDD70_13365 [Bdellovibrionales bacterium]|nr:hypothetical protein [Bdellovibrionales bacterium]